MIVTTYVILDHPEDRPDMFVLRANGIDATGKVVPMPGEMVSHFLDDLRIAVGHLAPGAVCFSRCELSPPHVIEEWL